MYLHEDNILTLLNVLGAVKCDLYIFNFFFNTGANQAYILNHKFLKT